VQEWKETPDGWRTWTRFDTGARWLYRGGGIAARKADGSPIPLPPGPAQATANALTSRYARAIARVVAGDPHADWYVRAMLALMCVECPPGNLPCYGLWKTPDGKVVTANTPGATPNTVGVYQLLRSTAKKLGYAWDVLAKDGEANHRAAFKLAKELEPQHGHDFVTLAALWNAGSIKHNAANTWGVVMDRPDTLSQYARAYIAVKHELLGGTPGARDDGGGKLALFVALLLGS